MRTCAIFAGGVMDDPSFIDAEELRQSCDFIICADSGYKYCKALGIVPDFFVGDLDSCTEEIPEGIDMHRSVPEKDDTDTMLAIREAISRGITEIRLYGALGARFDHSFANIQSMVYAREHGCDLKIIDRDNELWLQGVGDREYEYREGFYLSVFALTETTEISLLRGVKYPLTNCIMRQSFPLGVSNEITGDRAFLRIGSGIALVMRSRM